MTKISKSKSADQQPTTGKPQKANIFEWSKKKIENDSIKLNKIMGKLQKSIDNHSKELDDKKAALEECKNELKQLDELVKQV
jgi:archaellum component FlaC